MTVKVVSSGQWIADSRYRRLSFRSKALLIFGCSVLEAMGFDAVANIMVGENLDAELAHPSVAPAIGLAAEPVPPNRRNRTFRTNPFVDVAGYQISKFGGFGTPFGHKMPAGFQPVAKCAARNPLRTIQEDTRVSVLV